MSYNKNKIKNKKLEQIKMKSITLKVRGAT